MRSHPPAIPRVSLPIPPTDDEVAELARTLDQMLAELEAAGAETQQMVTAQREFVADASHELRTPLTSVLANLELLATTLPDRAGADPGEARETVESARRSAQRMSRLVADLLLLARADAGRSAAWRSCDLAQIAEDAIVGSTSDRGRTRDRRDWRGRCPLREARTSCTGWSPT